MFLICDVSQLIDGQDVSNKENMDPNKTDDWLHMNDSLRANNIDDVLIPIGYQVIKLLLICVAEPPNLMSSQEYSSSIRP
jgi:hypothetical protein